MVDKNKDILQQKRVSCVSFNALSFSTLDTLPYTDKKMSDTGAAIKNNHGMDGH